MDITTDTRVAKVLELVKLFPDGVSLLGLTYCVSDMFNIVDIQARLIIRDMLKTGFVQQKGWRIYERN